VLVLSQGDGRGSSDCFREDSATLIFTEGRLRELMAMTCSSVWTSLPSLTCQFQTGHLSSFRAVRCGGPVPALVGEHFSIQSSAYVLGDERTSGLTSGQQQWHGSHVVSVCAHHMATGVAACSLASFSQQQRTAIKQSDTRAFKLLASHFPPRSRGGCTKGNCICSRTAHTFSNQETWLSYQLCSNGLMLHYAGRGVTASNCNTT
jgi:hypothetical protein